MILYNRVGRGTYWRALGYAQQLAHNHNYEVTIMAVSPTPIRHIQTHTQSSPLGTGTVTIIKTPDLMPASGYDPYDSIQRLLWLRGKDYELIHAFECRPVVILPALYAQRMMGVPLVTDWCDWFGRGGSVERRENPFLRAMLRQTETFFEETFRPSTAGTTVINSILQNKALALGIPQEKILLLHNGANIDEIVPENKNELRAKYQLPLDGPIFAYTGAIFNDDAQLMAKTFDLIVEKIPTARLLMIGYCNIDLKALVKYPQQVIQTGQISYAALADYVVVADVGLLALSNTGANQGRFPMKLHDFMAAGVPVVVSDVGDLGTFISDRGIGRVGEDNAIDLARVSIELISKPHIHQMMGQQARKIAETEFAWSIVTQKLHTFYQKILNTSKTAR
ncbi:MAG: glycosyltransferase [Chloroflexota bacterium]